MADWTDIPDPEEPSRIYSYELRLRGDGVALDDCTIHLDVAAGGGFTFETDGLDCTDEIETSDLAAAKLEALALVRARLAEALRAVDEAIEAGKPRVPRGHCGRCDWCGWEYQTMATVGCTARSCSQRPRPERRTTCAGCGAPFEAPMVREIDGQLVLDDPAALAAIRAIEKHNLRAMYEQNSARVAYFKSRVEERGLVAADVVVVLIDVDDPNGGHLGEALMPGADWQSIRDRGEVPVARGIARRDGIQEWLEIVDAEAAEKLRTTRERIAVVVVGRGVVEVFA